MKQILIKLFNKLLEQDFSKLTNYISFNYGPDYYLINLLSKGKIAIIITVDYNVKKLITTDNISIVGYDTFNIDNITTLFTNYNVNNICTQVYYIDFNGQNVLYSQNLNSISISKLISNCGSKVFALCNNYENYTSGKGFGSIMFKIAFIYAILHKSPNLIITTVVGNVKMQTFAEKCGYKPKYDFYNTNSGNTCTFWQMNIVEFIRNYLATLDDFLWLLEERSMINIKQFTDNITYN